MGRKLHDPDVIWCAALGIKLPLSYHIDDRECHPDFIIHLKTPKTRYVILETKGYVYEGTEEMKFTKP